MLPAAEAKSAFFLWPCSLLTAKPCSCDIFKMSLNDCYTRLAVSYTHLDVYKRQASLNGNIFRCWRRTVRFRCYGNLSAVTALPASVYRTNLYQKRLIIQQFFSIKFINCQRIYRCFDNFCFSIICNGNLLSLIHISLKPFEEHSYQLSAGYVPSKGANHQPFSFCIH